MTGDIDFNKMNIVLLWIGFFFVILRHGTGKEFPLTIDYWSRYEMVQSISLSQDSTTQFPSHSAACGDGLIDEPMEGLEWTAPLQMAGGAKYIFGCFPLVTTPCA